MQSVYDAIDTPLYPKEELCGIFFFNGYAYCTNSFISSRISVTGDLDKNSAVFWSYIDNAPIAVSQELIKDLKEIFKGNIDYLFDSYKENYFFLKKQLVINLILEKFKTEKNMKKSYLQAKIENSQLIVNFLNSKGKLMYNSKIPLFDYFSNKTRFIPGTVFCISVFYLYKILAHSFFDYDIIGFKLNSEPQSNIVIFGKNKTGKVEIQWLIHQIILKMR